MGFHRLMKLFHFRYFIDKITNIVYNVIKKESSMTKSEISDTLDIPLTTLYDWEKEEHSKYKLYTLLSNLDKKAANKIINKTKDTHRILHILNRNTSDKYKYTKEEIKKAFTKKDYKLATQREKIIYSRFFKECDEEDLRDLVETFHVSKRDIKLVYTDIPERAFPGVAKVWDRRFRINDKVNKVANVNISKKTDRTDFAKKYLNKKNESIGV